MVSNVDSFILHSVEFSYNPSQAQEDAKSFEQTMVVKDLLEAAKIALADVNQWILNQLGDCEHHSEALRLRAGFGSLPDEILSKVFEFAVPLWDEDEPETDWIDDNINYYAFRAVLLEARLATNFSHVCRRFRNLVLSSSKHWSRICSMMQPGMVSTYVSRCKSMDACFDVHMRSPVYQGAKDALESFLHTAVNSSQLWKRFIHDWHTNHYMFPSAEEITSDTLPLYGLNAPHLSQITLRFPYEIYGDKAVACEARRAMHYYSTWSTPRLRSMKTSDLIPIPFSGSDSLSTLSIYVDLCRQYPGLDVKSLVNFIASCPVLEDFTLQVCESLPELEPLVLHRMELKTVTKLDLAFKSCDVSAMRHFIDAVHFPNVTVASLRLLWISEAQEFIQTMFPGSNVFPNLVRLLIMNREWTQWDEMVASPNTIIIYPIFVPPETGTPHAHAP